MSSNENLPARLQRFYEELAVERRPALDRLSTVFTDDVRFRDPFRETRGMGPFRELFERMLRQYSEVGFTDFRCLGAGDAFTLLYDMRLRMPIGPTFVTPMASICVARDGKVAELHDYYDFASGLVSPLRLLGIAYRATVNAAFL